MCIVILAGCRVDFGVATRADFSGAGTLSLSISADEESQAELDAAGFAELASVLGGGDPGPEGFAIWAALAASGWDVTVGDGGVRIEHDFASAEQLSVLAGDLSPLVTAMSLGRTATAFKSELDYRAGIDFSRETLAALATDGLESPPSAAEIDNVLRRPLGEVFGLEFRVELSGDMRVESSTRAPDDMGSGAVVWNLAVGERLDVNIGSRAYNWAGIGLAVAVVALLVASGLSFVIWRRRS